MAEGRDSRLHGNDGGGAGRPPVDSRLHGNDGMGCGHDGGGVGMTDRV